MNSRFVKNLALCLPAFMIAFDPMAVSLLLNPLANLFSKNLSSIVWLLSIFLMLGSAFFITGERLAELCGRKRLLLIGLGIFFVASFLNGFAEQFSVLMIGRAFQGIAAALILMSSLCYMDENDSRDRYGLYTWWIFVLVGIAIGPLLSDGLIYAYTWHSVFFFEALLSAISFIAVCVAIENTKGQTQAIDLLAPVLWVVGLSCVGYWLMEVTYIGWSSFDAIKYLFVAVLIFVAFFVYEKVRMKHLNVNVDHRLEFYIANIVGFVAYILMFAWLVLFGTYLQAIMDFSVWQAGKMYLPMTIPLALAIFPMRRIAGKYGFAVCIGLGVLLTAIASVIIITFAHNASYVELIVSFVLFGLGLSGFFYIAHNRYSTNLAQHKQTRALRFSILWLGAYLSVSFFAAFYTTFSQYELGILDMLIHSTDEVWNYAIEICWIILLVLSLLMLAVGYVQWRIERKA